MLVLTRHVGESICIGPDITVTVVQLSGGKVRIGIEAPPDAVILRRELLDNGRSPQPHSAPTIVGPLPLNGVFDPLAGA